MTIQVGAILAVIAITEVFLLHEVSSIYRLIGVIFQIIGKNEQEEDDW